jgi:hypothetical protein
VTELPMRFHPLTSDVKCPACGADITFVRVRRGYGDLYQCVSGPCRCEIIHYRSKETHTCGYAAISRNGAREAWTACGETAAKE